MGGFKLEVRHFSHSADRLTGISDTKENYLHKVFSEIVPKGAQDALASSYYWKEYSVR